MIISANQGVLPLTKEPLGFLLNKRTINYFSFSGNVFFFSAQKNKLPPLHPPYIELQRYLHAVLPVFCQ
ncbi:MAG: hypothetical protein ACE5J3_09490, partial [Methanosarcinales archaeon]